MDARPAASDLLARMMDPGLADLEMLLRDRVGQVFQPWRSDNRELAHPAGVVANLGRWQLI